MNTEKALEKLKGQAKNAVVSTIQLIVTITIICVVLGIGFTLYGQHRENVEANARLDAQIAQAEDTRTNLDAYITQAGEAIDSQNVNGAKKLLARLRAASGDERIDQLQIRYDALVREKHEQRISDEFDQMLAEHRSKGCEVAASLYEKVKNTKADHPRIREVKRFVARLDDCRVQLLRDDFRDRMDTFKLARRGYADSVRSTYAGRHSVSMGTKVIEAGDGAQLQLFHPVFDHMGEAQNVHAEISGMLRTMGFTSVKYIGNVRSWREQVSDTPTTERVEQLQRQKLPAHYFETWVLTGK